MLRIPTLVTVFVPSCVCLLTHLQLKLNKKVLRNTLLVTMSEMTQNIQDIQDAHKRHTLWPEGQELGKLIAVYYYKALLRQNSRL